MVIYYLSQNAIYTNVISSRLVTSLECFKVCFEFIYITYFYFKNKPFYLNAIIDQHYLLKFYPFTKLLFKIAGLNHNPVRTLLKIINTCDINTTCFFIVYKC